MLPLLAALLVVTGALGLTRALLLTRYIVARLPRGAVRTNWYCMRALIVGFLISYLGYAWTAWGTHREIADFLVPTVFFFGAGFVLLSTVLSLATADSLSRINDLEEENGKDPLTGVANRRHLDRRLASCFLEARQSGSSLSVLLIDIDHFKRVNDQHGHQAGDQVLLSLAQALNSEMREQDLLARYGGEEFIVVAPRTDSQGAFELAERLRIRVQGHVFVLPGEDLGRASLRITCSVGVATLSQDMDQVAVIVRQADQNLYTAKRDGRNRVCAALPKLA